jgi:ectoine hydroxylase-related dioxygenase (phytanoyl-CoA dioxygenase family)
MNYKIDFDRDGFLALRGFYGQATIDRVQRSVDDKIAERPLEVSVDNMNTGERLSLGIIPDEYFRAHRFKVNDLFLNVESVRNLALSDKIASILGELLGETPVLCNSLYFEKGSAQPPHVDALYMTPRTHGHLIAIWVALEDSHEDAGQLEYFPGSHRIEQMRFSNGSYHFIPEEMPKWISYMDEAVEAKDLQKRRFAAKKGDVFIWHAHLLHGGSPIADGNRTRRSLVFHYYTAKDCLGDDLRPQGGAYWLQRDPQDTGELTDLYKTFPAEAYLAINPDVAEAVAAGETTPWEHYFGSGRHEGRLFSFDESAYLSMHPDVATAIVRGDFRSGAEHYRLCGKAEGRRVA